MTASVIENILANQIEEETRFVSHCVFVVEVMSRVRSRRKHRRFLRRIPPRFVGLKCGVTQDAVSPWRRRTSRGGFSRRGATRQHFTTTGADTHRDQNMFIYSTHTMSDSQKK